MWAGWALCADVPPRDTHPSWEHGIPCRNTHFPSPASVSTSTPQSGCNCSNPVLQDCEGPSRTICAASGHCPSPTSLPLGSSCLLCLTNHDRKWGYGGWCSGSYCGRLQCNNQRKDGGASFTSEETRAQRARHTIPRCPSIKSVEMEPNLDSWLQPLHLLRHSVRPGASGGTGVWASLSLSL